MELEQIMANFIEQIMEHSMVNFIEILWNTS